MKPISISSFLRHFLVQIQIRVLALCFLAALPLFFLAAGLIQRRAINASLMSVKHSIEQSLSTGNEIGLMRQLDSLLLIPEVSRVEITLPYEKTAILRTKPAIGVSLSPRFEQTSVEVLNISGTSTPGELTLHFLPQWEYIIVVGIAFLFVLFLANRMILVRTKQFASELNTEVTNLSTSFYDEGKTFRISEIDRVRQILLENHRISLENSENNAIKKVSQQVAHDIRSPLSALEMFAAITKDIPADKRIILKNVIIRIKEIAKTLTADNHDDTFRKPDLENLYLMIDGIIAEKTLEFSKGSPLSISLNVDDGLHFVSVNVDRNEFGRIVSNLINNGIEATANLGRPPNIEVKIYRTPTKKIGIDISDNGCGMPDQVLRKIGETGNTLNKREGKGLGIYHATQALPKWGGTLSFEVQNNRQGTTAKIELPESPSQEWLRTALNFRQISAVVVLDDDLSIHTVWTERLKSFQRFHLHNPSELRRDFSNYLENLETTHFLIDLEFAGTPETGLDVIKELGLSEFCTLVTNQYENKDVISICKNNRIHVLPKPLVAYVPVSLDSPL